MKRLLTSTVCTMGIIFQMVAYSPIERSLDLPGIPKSRTVSVVTSETEESPTNFVADKMERIASKNPMKKSAGDMVSVTFRFPEIGDGCEWEMPWFKIKVYNDQGYYEEVEIPKYDDEWNPITHTEWQCELPVGVVDIFSLFKHRNSDRFFGSDPMVYYILEQVELFDGIVLDLKPEESNICLGMYPTIPSGEKVKLRKISYDEEWNYEILEEGNVTDDLMYKMIFYKGIKIESLATNAFGFELIPGPHGMHDPYAEMNFYVNEVGDDYVFRVIHRMPSWPDETDGIYIAVTETAGARTGVYGNGSYTLDEEHIMSTPAHEDYPLTELWGEPVYPYGFILFPYGSMTGRALESSLPEIWRIWNSKPEKPVNPEDRYYSIVRNLNDIQITDEEMGWSFLSGTQCTNIYPFADNGYTYCQFGIGYLNLLETGYQPDAILPGNPVFMSMLDNMKVVAGGTAPLLSCYLYSMYDWASYKMVNYINGYYRGRAGEMIGSDIALAKSCLKVNDEVVSSEFGTAQNWMIANQDVKGKYEMQISTDNFEIDGIRGGNTAIVTFDTSLEDGVPPTATFLQTRLNGDIVTQEFKNTDGAEIYLSAADLTICYSEPDEEGWQYSYCEFSTPAKVTAYATPTGIVTEVYDEIELTEHPDKFYAPGFGAFYTGSLESVRQTSPTGWFDLTLTVEDEAGNRQVQTLSPAFKIESLTAAIAAPMGQDNEVYVRDGRIVMPEGSRVYTVDGRLVSADSAVKGMYIVVTPKRGYRIVL